MESRWGTIGLKVLVFTWIIICPLMSSLYVDSDIFEKCTQRLDLYLIMTHITCLTAFATKESLRGINQIEYWPRHIENLMLLSFILSMVLSVQYLLAVLICWWTFMSTYSYSFKHWLIFYVLILDALSVIFFAKILDYMNFVGHRNFTEAFLGRPRWMGSNTECRDLLEKQLRQWEKAFVTDAKSAESRRQMLECALLLTYWAPNHFVGHFESYFMAYFYAAYSTKMGRTQNPVWCDLCGSQIEENQQYVTFFTGYEETHFDCFERSPTSFGRVIQHFKDMHGRGNWDM